MTTENKHIKQYKEHTGNVTPFGLHFKRIGNNIVDVFSGEGFGVPSRLRLIRGTWSHLSGPKLNMAEQVALVTALS